MFSSPKRKLADGRSSLGLDNETRKMHSYVTYFEIPRRVDTPAFPYQALS